MPSKAEIRKELRLRRQAFVAARSGAPWQLPARAIIPWRQAARTLASYYPYGSEADPAPLVAAARARNLAIAWPRVDTDGCMRFYLPGSSAAFAPDAAGIKAPSDDATVVLPDIILLPLVGFDRTGTRLGQGGGHYDRALSRNNPLSLTTRPQRIGIGWSVQECPALPRDPWDVPMDYIVTEQEWITP